MHHDYEQHEDDGTEEAAECRIPLTSEHLVHRESLTPLPLFGQELGVGWHHHGPTGSSCGHLDLASDWILDEKHGDVGGCLRRARGGRWGDDEAPTVGRVADLTSEGVRAFFANPALDAVVVSVLLSPRAAAWRNQFVWRVFFEADAT